MSRVNTQPQLFQNPFVNPGSVTPTGLSRLGSRRPREREDINVQLARSLLLDPKITDTHRLRLKGIIAANSPADREAQEKIAEREARRLAQFFDKNPGLTQEEGEQLRQQFTQDTGQFAPRQLTFRAETERDNPQLQLSNLATLQATVHGVEQDYALSLNGIDKDTGLVDYEHALKVDQYLSSRNQAQTGQMSAVKNRMRTIQDRLKVIRENRTLFDNEGNRLEQLTTSSGLFNTFQETVDAQSAGFFEHDTLASELAGLERRETGFVTSFDPPTPAPAPTRQPEATITAPLAIPEFSATQPYTLQPNDDISAIARAAQEWARTNGPTIIIDPATNKMYEIK